MENNFLIINKDYFNLNLKIVDIFIIAQIEEFEKNDYECYITNQQFAEMSGESESTIKRALDKLEEFNIIKRDTKFVKSNGKANKQRVIKLNKREKWKVHFEPCKTQWKVHIDPTKSEWKVHNEPCKLEMEGSKVDDGRFKNDEWKVHIDPIKDKEKDNKKISSLARVGAYPRAHEPPVAEAPSTTTVAGAPLLPPSSNSFSEVASLPNNIVLKIFELWSGNKIKIKDIIEKINSEDNIKITPALVNKIIDKYKANRSELDELKFNIDKDKTETARQEKISVKDKKHYDEVSRLSEVLEVLQMEYIDTKIKLSELVKVYNDSYEEAKSQTSQDCKHDFTVDQMLKFLNNHIKVSGVEINNILTLRRLWNQNRKDFL